MTQTNPDPKSANTPLPHTEGTEANLIARGRHEPPRPNGSEKVRVSVKEAIVLWLLLYHADLTDEQIARIAGCHPKSLYRMPFFNRMRRLLRECGAVLLPRNSSEHGYEPVLRD